MTKFLIIRFSSIGDIVLTTPVIRCLKKQVKEAEIHFLTKKQFFPVIKANPYIDKIHLFDDNFGELVKLLQKENYHYIIDLHHNIRTYRLKNHLRVLSFSFKKLNVEKWLLVNLRINRLPSLHIVDRYLSTVNIFDVKNDNYGLDYFIPGEEEINIPGIPGDYPLKYIVFVIGAKHITKQIPSEIIVDICNKINYPIFLLGGEEDFSKAEFIKEKCTGKVYNLCGKYSINQSASFIRQSKLVITPDTGLMHIAAAFKKKIISIWGNTIPEFGMYPYLPNDGSEIIQVDNLHCRPCSKLGFDRCPKKHFKCMRLIDTDKIVAIVMKLLKA